MFVSWYVGCVLHVEVLLCLIAIRYIVTTFVVSHVANVMPIFHRYRIINRLWVRALLA
jgi:hypothetical protein